MTTIKHTRNSKKCSRQSRKSIGVENARNFNLEEKSVLNDKDVKNDVNDVKNDINDVSDSMKSHSIPCQSDTKTTVTTESDSDLGPDDLLYFDPIKTIKNLDSMDSDVMSSVGPANLSDIFLSPLHATSVVHNTHRKFCLRPDKNRYSTKIKVSCDNLPSKFSLEDGLPKVFNQADLGSCSSNAIIGAFEYKIKGFDGSRLFHYYCERDKLGDTEHDSGSTITAGVKVLHELGVCTESKWPYDTKRFAEKPGKDCYKEAKDHKLHKFKPLLNTHESIKSALFKFNQPIVLGILIYESFQNPDVAKTGKVPMPEPDEEILGGHAVTLYGWNEQDKTYLFRNSWGEEWGDRGNFTLPMEYVEDANICSDCWQLLDHSTSEQSCLKQAAGDIADKSIELVRFDSITKSMVLLNCPEKALKNTADSSSISTGSYWWSWLGY